LLETALWAVFFLNVGPAVAEPAGYSPNEQWLKICSLADFSGALVQKARQPAGSATQDAVQLMGGFGRGETGGGLFYNLLVVYVLCKYKAVMKGVFSECGKLFKNRG